jgi:hypothetical protein
VPEIYSADEQASHSATRTEAGVASGFAPPSPPTSHGITHVHIMSRDPHSVFAYWELTPEFREMTARHFRCNWDDLPLILRLYMVDATNGELVIVREQRVSGLVDNWLFGDLAPGRSYVLDLGTTNVYNVFVALIRSNTVNTPRNWPGRSAYGRPLQAAWPPEAISSSFHHWR